MSRMSQTPVPEQRNTPRLSDKEKAERLAARQCFVCKETGHFSRDCPTKRMVRLSGGKPPGATAFNIEPTLSDVKDDADVEVLDSLPIGMMLFEDLPSEPDDIEPLPQHEHLRAWGDVSPYWHHPGILPRHQLGDCLALVA